MGTRGGQACRLSCGSHRSPSTPHTSSGTELRLPLMRTADRLAVDGGTPVRQTFLDFSRGAGLLGDEERSAVLEVLESRSLFRYYGPHLLGRVSEFEGALAEFTGTNHAVATLSLIHI